jgi:hypothetical protein
VGQEGGVVGQGGGGVGPRAGGAQRARALRGAEQRADGEDGPEQQHVGGRGAQVGLKLEDRKWGGRSGCRRLWSLSRSIS